MQELSAAQCCIYAQWQVEQHDEVRSVHLAQALSELVEVVQCSTDREAINMGIWMHETLSLLARWRVRAPSVEVPRKHFQSR